MHFTAATIAALAFASTASAHATMFSVWVNGVDQGDGRSVYIRSPTDNSPIKDLASPNLACNVNGGKEVPSFVEAAAGAKLEFEWFHDNRNDDIIADSHKGPIATYIAPYTSGNGAKAIWTKIAEEGYDKTTNRWATEKLASNKGKKDFTLPANLKAGKYLIRQEIIALHEADRAFKNDKARGAQFYPSCVQFEVTGSGSAVPSENFDFNTGYTYSDPGILFDLYSSFSSYPVPGPKISTFASNTISPVVDVVAVVPSAAASSAAASSAKTSSTSAVVPTTLATLVRSSTVQVSTSTYTGQQQAVPTAVRTRLAAQAAAPTATASKVSGACSALRRH
ncbi:glycosyl hydrolase family 61-domain-containing protein [Bombardia bombarda]|uniref:lytic cellulose monooxygenase (C4-dehydrogenating) n=1 Tax=Bombardia bombarda TaxID=252184 RepID=A0AA39U486_9PEZI|nr:glycosyl hydrolase family 61-domain-containing protein [Bombardia bombarda]